MLWALALLGLVPAAFAFSDLELDGDNSDEDTSDVGDTTQESAGDDMSGSDGSTDMLDFAAADDGEDDMPPEETSDASDSEVGDDYVVTHTGGETLFADFAPDEDHVTLALGDDGAGEFVVEPLLNETGEEIGTSLSYVTGEDETILSFLDHDTLPVDDISVALTDPESGETILYALSEFGDFGAIEPNDPDVPDEAGPVGDADDLVLSVNDPDIAGEAGPEGSDDDEVLTPIKEETDATGAPTGETVKYTLSDAGETLVLANDEMQGGTDATLTLDDDGLPTIETEGTLNIVTGGAGDDVIAAGDDAAIVHAEAGNDTIYGGDGTSFLSGGAGDDTIYAGIDTGSSYVLSGDEGVDVLYGGAGDDTILMDAQDTATGGEGADEFWLSYDANADVGYARITDFSEGEDVLRVILDPNDSYSGTLDVDVTQTKDGFSSQVIVNGDVVAVLYGAPNVTLADVFVEVSQTALSA